MSNYKSNSQYRREIRALEEENEMLGEETRQNKTVLRQIKTVLIDMNGHLADGNYQMRFNMDRFWATYTASIIEKRRAEAAVQAIDIDLGELIENFEKWAVAEDEPRI